MKQNGIIWLVVSNGYDIYKTFRKCSIMDRTMKSATQPKLIVVIQPGT